MSIIRLLSYFAVFFPIFINARLSLAGDSSDSNCIRFEYPRHGAVIRSAGCTLSVEACPDIESIHLGAHYYRVNGSSDTSLDLGTITQPPFKLIWNIADIPNQLFRGMGFVADGVLKNGKHQTIKREGVFLYCKPVPIQAMTLSGATARASLLWCDTLSFKKAPTILRVSGGCTTKEMQLIVVVADPFFSSAISQDNLSNLGAEVLLDPHMAREPFPSDKTVMIRVSLGKKTSLLSYKKIDSDSTPADFTVDTVDYAFPSTVKMVEGKGYRIDVRVPAAAVGGVLPDSLGCNVVIKLPDREGQAIAVSMNGATGLAAYCPLLWGTLHRRPSGILDDAKVIVLSSFCFGLIIALAIGLPRTRRRRRVVAFNISELSEEEKRRVQKTYRFIEQNVTQKNLSLHDVSTGLSLQGSKIEALIIKFTGQSFKNFVMKSRVEIAKERLRCSHSSEKAIAESCGFDNVDQMEKCFRKCCRTTPYKYRRDNQMA